MLDDKLNRKPQIEKLVTKLSKSCGNLFKLKHYANISVLRFVQFSIFRSHPFYSIHSWGRYNKTTLLLQIRLRNKSVRALKYKKTKTDILHCIYWKFELPDSFKLSVA